MNDAAPSVLIVDDDERLRATLVRGFLRRGWNVREAGNLAQALTMAQAESPEHAVVDLRMADGSGIDLVRELHALDPGTRIVLLTGFGSIATAVAALRAGALHYLTKPADIEQILRAFGGEIAETPSSVPSLERVEWEHIQRVLLDCNGNVTQAAVALGIHRRSLQRKLQRNPRVR